MKIALALLLLLPAVAFANAWNERDLTWNAPTACFDGDPDLTHCPVTGYKVEVAGSCTALTWNALATVTGTSYHVTNLKAGSYCFRARAVTAGGDSDPSSIGATSKTVVTAPLPARAGAPSSVTVT